MFNFRDFPFVLLIVSVVISVFIDTQGLRFMKPFMKPMSVEAQELKYQNYNDLRHEYEALYETTQPQGSRDKHLHHPDRERQHPDSHREYSG